MKYKHTQNLGWCRNGEKLKEQTINLGERLGGVPMMTNQSKKNMTLERTYDVVRDFERINIHQT